LCPAVATETLDALGEESAAFTSDLGRRFIAIMAITTD